MQVFLSKCCLGELTCRWSGRRCKTYCTERRTAQRGRKVARVTMSECELYSRQADLRGLRASKPIEGYPVVPATSQSIQCNLCSLMDCFKLARPQPTVTEESTEVTFHASTGSQGDVVLTDTARRRRPVRPRFPGVAVDPASVGLELLPALNESQLQLVLDGRSRRARDAETPARRDS